MNDKLRALTNLIVCLASSTTTIRFATGKNEKQFAFFSIHGLVGVTHYNVISIFRQSTLVFLCANCFSSCRLASGRITVSDNIRAEVNFDSVLPVGSRCGYVRPLRKEEPGAWFDSSKDQYGFFMTNGALWDSASSVEDLIQSVVVGGGWVLLPLH